MDAFFLSSIASFMLTLLMLASTTTQRGRKIKYAAGDALRFEADRPVFILVVFGIAVIFIVVVVLFILGRIHPQGGTVYSWSDFVAGRLFTSVVLGLLFGSLFAFWLRDLLWVQRKRTAGWRPVVQTVVLAVLLLIGAFSDILVSYAYRISQINIGGTQLTFTQPRESDRESQGLGGLAQNIGSPNVASAQALGVIANIARFTGNDLKYAQYLFPAQFGTPDVISVPDTVKAVGNFGGCLSGIAEENPHDSLVEAQVRAFASPMREIIVMRDRMAPERRTAIARQLVRIADTVRKHVDAGYLRRNPQGKDEEESIKKLKELCTKIMAVAHRSEVLDRLSLMLGQETWFSDEPYAALLYAAVLWRLGDYTAAIGELDAWLREADNKKIHPWKKVRARIYIGIMAEEWIRRPGGPPQGLIEYHLANLEATIELMRPLVSKLVEIVGASSEDSERDGFRERPPFGGFQCSNIVEAVNTRVKDDNSDDARTLRSAPKKLSEELGTLRDNAINLSLTWLSQHVVFAYRATQSSDYFDRYSSRASTYLNFTLRRDIFCLKNSFPEFAAPVDELYADALQTVVAVELANVERIQSLPDRDAVKRRLDRALQAANLGLSLVRPHATAARRTADRATSLVSMFEPNKFRELEDGFKGAQRRIARLQRSL